MNLFPQFLIMALLTLYLMRTNVPGGPMTLEVLTCAYLTLALFLAMPIVELRRWIFELY